MKTPEMRFITSFLLATIIILGSIIALSILIDPRGLFGTNKFTPLVATDRPAKLELIKNQSPAPDIIILGSSRVFKIDPETITKKTRLHAFNFGVNNAKPEEFLALAKYLIEDLKIKPQLFIVAIDHDAFDNQRIQPQTIHISKLRSKLNISKKEYLSVFLTTFKENLTFQYIKDIGRSIYYIIAGYPKLPPRLKSNGYMIKNVYKKDVPENFNTHSGNVILNVFKTGGAALSVARQNYFEQFLNLAKENNIKIKMALLPMHPIILERLNEQPEFKNTCRLLTDYLITQSKKYGYDYYDFTDIQSFNGDPEDFSDLVHTNDANLQKIIDIILKK